ncbi:MAG: hypothetical protein ACLF0P_03790 [Thermoanaerobaculia bacterium]
MKTREFPRGMTFVAILAALLLAFPAVGLAGEKGEASDQEYEPPTEEQQQEQEEAHEQEREKTQAEREMEAREQREQRAQMEREAEPQAGQTTSVTLTVPRVQAQELASQPRQYFGELIQLSAQVDKKHGDHMLTLQAEGVRTDGQQNLVVVLPKQAAADIPEGEDLHIVGHVRPLLWTEFERDYAWFNMDLVQEFQQEIEQTGMVRTDQPETQRQERPVLIATSIKTQDGKELLQHEGAESKREGRSGGTDR